MKTLILPITILTLSLGAAWVQFTAEPDTLGDNEVLVMAGQASQIERIDWVSTKQEVHIEQRTDDQGTHLWVQYVDHKVPEEPSIKYFIAGDNGNKLLEALSPLVAIRQIDSTADLKSLGLQDPSATLVVTSNGSVRSFSVGNEAYGTKDLYVRDDASQELFLIDDSKLRNIRQARTTLPNRSIFPRKPQEATAAILDWNDKSLAFTHQNFEDAKNAKWVLTGSSDVDDTQIETWLSKALRTSVSRSAAPEEDLSTLEDQFSLTLTWSDDFKTTTTYAFMSTDESWWAKNPSTRGYVRVSGKTLSTLLEDIPALFEK